MGRVCRILIAMTFLGLVLTSDTFADTWTDTFSGSALNTDMWTYVADGSHASDIDYSIGGGKLSWLSDGWTGGSEAESGIVFKNAMSIENDIAVSVVFHYSAQGTRENDSGMIGFAMADVGSGSFTDPDRVFGVFAGHMYLAEYSANLPYCGSAIKAPELISDDNPEGAVEDVAARYINDGTAFINYASDSDVLYYGISWPSGSVYYDASIEDFSATYDVDNLYLGISLSSIGAPYSSGEAFIDSVIIEGTPVGAAPEPVSCALFVVGGALVGIRRFKKR